MSENRQDIGRKGEELARKHLQEHGYKILATNVENDRGELDLIAYESDSEVFVFVEVRTRRDGLFRGERSIDDEKRRRIVQAASRFLAQRNALGVSHRFDVIGITLHEQKSPEIRHHKSAFSR